MLSALLPVLFSADSLLDTEFSLAFQLLSVITAGGSSGVEDQTNMLGFTAERSKCIKCEM